MATVVLVGRPNTGKSTLFNRLVRARVAITLREPGITRDRIIRSAEWLGRRFQVIDTGGLVPGSSDEITRLIEQQVEVALKEADLIILVVDGRAGLSPPDEEVAGRLRAKGRRFLVAVNKVDASRTFEDAEFHRLGGQGLFAISAEHGTGVDELLDAVIARLPDRPPDVGPAGLALAILGRPNVGKSSFLNALLGDTRAIVTATPGTTRDAIEESFRFEGCDYRLIDTAGIRRKARVTEAVEYFSVARAVDVIDRCDVAFLVLDATEGPTAQDKRIANLIEDRGKGLVAVANKMDIVPRDLGQQVRDYVRRHLSFVGYAPVVFTSVLEGSGITDAVREAGRVHEAGGRQLSAALLKASVLRRLLARPPAPDCRVLGLSQTGTRPPGFRLRVAGPGEVSPAYVRYVVTEVRRVFGFDGYPIRLRISR